jgi:DNA-binding CsgD family transcriptional regulator
MLLTHPLTSAGRADGRATIVPSTTSPPSSLLSLAVDSLKQALLVFDDAGCVLGANAAAHRTIEQRTDVELAASPEPPHDRVRLMVRRTALQLRLERALRGSPGVRPGAFDGAARPAGACSRGPQALVLAEDAGQPSLILQLTPIDPSAAHLVCPSAVLLGVLIDRRCNPSLDTAMLRELFGMTDAEARVSEAYLRVDTVKDVAQLLGVSVNTVKTHLAAAYLKTGCTRQAQFVRLLMALSELGEMTPAGRAA